MTKNQELEVSDFLALLVGIERRSERRRTSRGSGIRQQANIRDRFQPRAHL